MTIARITSPDRGRRWACWQLHLGSNAGAVSDRVLRHLVAPIVSDLETPWFFIRYWQSGPHVRLRIADLDEARIVVLEDALVAGLPGAAALVGPEQPLDPETFADVAGRHARSETGENRSVQPLREPGVYPGSYDPEFDRYGGPRNMRSSEDLFWLSSRLTLGLLERLQPGQRPAAVMRLTRAAASTLGDLPEQTAFFTYGRQMWIGLARSYGYSDQAIRAATAVGADAGRAMSQVEVRGPFAMWRDGVVELAGVLGGEGNFHPEQVISSHIHMTHNRLGMGLLEELRTYAWLAGSATARR